MQCIHSHLSTDEEDAGFALELVAKCTKLKVLEFSGNGPILFFTRSSM